MDLITIKSWFRRGSKPTEAQFAATFDSFYHKQDNIPMSSVTNLPNSLANKSERIHTHTAGDITDITDITNEDILMLFPSEPDTPEPTEIVIAQAQADSATTMHATVGQIAVSSPSSQTANTGAVKLNTSGYLLITPAEGYTFAPGDILSVTLYNQASSSKTIGFCLAAANTNPQTGDQQPTDGHAQKTIQVTLLPEHINDDNTIKIYRYSSDGWFVAVSVLTIK